MKKKKLNNILQWICIILTIVGALAITISEIVAMVILVAALILGIWDMMLDPPQDPPPLI
jgi:hypothetical protein